MELYPALKRRDSRDGRSAFWFRQSPVFDYLSVYEHADHSGPVQALSEGDAADHHQPAERRLRQNSRADPPRRDAAGGNGLL